MHVRAPHRHLQVVVTQTLDWKLAHFDLVSEHQFASQYDLPLAAAAWLLPPQYKAGEVAKGDWQVGAEGDAAPAAPAVVSNGRQRLAAAWAPAIQAPTAS